MARIMNPFKGVVALLKGLSGGYNEELDDEIVDENLKEELKEIESMSAKNISALENRSGEQTMSIDDEKDTTDRLGIEKPKKGAKSSKTETTAKETQAHEESKGFGRD